MAMATVWKLYSSVAGLTMLGVAGGNGYYLYSQQRQLQRPDRLPHCTLGTIAIAFKSLYFGYLWPYTAYKLTTDPKLVMHPFYSMALDITLDRNRYLKGERSDTLIYASSATPSATTF